jgi:putative ATP-binding cassette transporter
MAAHVGGLERAQDWTAALSPQENRLLSLARVLLAAPRFVFLDRMDGELTPDQIDHIYQVLTDAGISYLSVGDHHRLGVHHDATLKLSDDGTWEIIAAQDANEVPGPASRA